jgi:hypothetical protein
MSAEILNNTPLSGEFPERHFGENYNSGLWIRFTDNNYEDWVGCFSRPYQTFDKVLTNSTNETAFVVAGEQGYLIDISSKELLHAMENIHVLESVIHTINPEYFLIGASYCIYIFDSKGLVKRYEPEFTVDGIYFTEQIGQKAIGHLYSYQFQTDLNVGFEFDLNTNELIIDKNVKIRQLGPFEFITVTDKIIKEKESIFTKLLRKLTDK